MAAADAGGAENRPTAERLTAALDSAVRLTLLDALSTATEEITRDIAPGAVEVRLRGREPEFVVTPPQPSGTPADPSDAPAPPRPGPPESPGPPERPDAQGWEPDETTSRITLRLPDTLKVRVEEAAAREGRSVNAWLVQAAVTALTDDRSHRRHHDERGSDRTEKGAWGIGQQLTGWAR